MAEEKPARAKPSITYDVVIHYPPAPAERQAKLDRGEYPSDCVVVAEGLTSHDLAKKIVIEQNNRLFKGGSTAYAAIVERGLTSPLQVNPSLPDRRLYERHD